MCTYFFFLNFIIFINRRYLHVPLYLFVIFRKIFVGGIAYDVTNEDLSQYFSQYGEVAQAQVKYDRNTGRSRGFAFVEFTTGEACRAALNAREQSLKGKTVEVKPAKSRENKKVFVGGLPADHPGIIKRFIKNDFVFIFRYNAKFFPSPMFKFICV